MKELWKGMTDVFPDFARNDYYLRYTGAEEKRMIALLGRSAAGFYWYYRGLWLYRKLRGTRRRRGQE